MIDIHVHLRDFEESHKETIAHGLLVASSVGYAALFEMPNTTPSLTTKREIERRIAFADQVLMKDQLPVFHGIYAGLTGAEGQAADMAACLKEHFPRVAGLKLYAGPSTGDLGVSEFQMQKRIFQELTDLGYQGALAVHCEDPKKFRTDEGLNHSQRRPVEAELSSVDDILAIAGETGFAGNLHICHVSTAEVLDLVESSRERLACRVSTGVTPHHLLLDDSLVKGDTGYLFTVNPPLRSEAQRAGLFQAALDGRIDVLESDHAPHELEDKQRGAAGLPGIPGMLCAVAYLVKHGIDGSLLTRMVFENPMEILSLDPEMLLSDHAGEQLSVLYRITNMFDQITSGGWVSLCERYRQNVDEYPWDPYEGLSREEFLSP